MRYVTLTPPRMVTPGEPVELREPGGLPVMMLIMGLVLPGAGAGFCFAAESWAGRLMAWPAGVVAIFAGGMIIYTACETRGTVIRAGTNGVRLDSPTRRQEAAWTQVARIVRLRKKVRRTAGYTWVLSDRNGQEIIRLDENLEPRAGIERLLDYIPGRAGVPIEQREE